MSNKFKIAVYSGEIPSTTFIERLIVGLSKNDCYIYLFGQQKKKVNYGKNILISKYSNSRFQKLITLLKYSFLLFFFKNSDKKKLDNYINKNSKNKTLSRIKFYPVLWHKPDILHLQWAKSIQDWNWVQQFGIKIIVSLRGTHINYSPIFDSKLAETYKTIFPQIDGFHAVSNAISVEAQKYGAVPDKIRVIYSGLQESHFSFNEKSNNKTFQILSVGRNHWVKGYTYALDTMNILSEKGIDFHYTIIGGKNSEELEYQKSTLQLNDKVTLTENISFSKVQEMMYHADLVVLSSVEEGIANVILEAMQIGTLVLTTNCGGMNEVIQNNKNGFIVPIRDSQKMADAIFDIMNLSEGKKQTIISEAKTTIEEQHTESKMVSEMLSLYKTVLKS